MSVETKSDSELILMLEQSSQLLYKIDLRESSEILDNINRYISSKIPYLLYKPSLNDQFHDLQNSIHKEFSTTNHKGNLIAFLLTAFRKSVKNHRRNLTEAINNNLMIDINEKRMNAYRNLQLLKKIILKGSDDNEERMIGIGYAYLSLVDGIYSSSLISCYVLQRVSENLPLNYESIAKMSVANIYDFFHNQSLPLYYFDGWDKTIRNAVAHSSILYDNVRERMGYKDIDGHIMEYNYPEMIENYEKLESIYPAILSTVQTTAIQDVINEFSLRYH